MARIEKQITISAPADRVFSYLADFPRHSEWAAHRLKIEPTSQGAVGQGTKFKSVGHQFGRDNEDTVTITEFVPNQKIVYESMTKEGQFRHWVELKPADGAVELTKGAQVLKMNFPLNVLFAIIGPFVLPSGLNRDLKRIKAKLEGS